MNFSAIKVKRIVIGTVFSVMLFSGAVPAFAAHKLYDEVTTENVTKGVVYEYNHRLTDEGWLNIHVLKIDLNQSNVKFAPVESLTEYGKKDTVLNMLSGSGAVAGVNADYFGMTGNYSASFGPTVKDGKLISAGTDMNLGSNDYSTFFIDENGSPFIDYFKFNIEFLNNGQKNIELASVNKITQMIYPIYFDKNAASSTKDLDARFQGLTKVVVENGVITYISQKGETVNVPDDGYLIILSEKFADASSSVLAVGQKAEIRVTASVDLEKIETAISGAGRILSNGVQPQYPGLIIKGRQPRTALGISEDKKTLVLMVVDGRGISIGATQDEMGSLMKEYGAYNAMHFDGGGSTTMVVKTADENNLNVVNTVSDGSQRRVMNALGLFDTSTVGEIKELVIKPSADRVFTGNELQFEVYGYDEFYHKISVPQNEIKFSSSDQAGVFNGNKFIPSTAGDIVVTAQYKDLSNAVSIDSMTVGALTSSAQQISLLKGQSYTANVAGTSTEGYSAALKSGVSYEVSDPSLGTFSNNVFTALQDGAGYIKVSAGNATYYIKVSIGGEEKAITSFDGLKDISYSSYPEVLGSVGPVTNIVQNGTNSLELLYNFAASNSTQAAYLNFNNPISINQNISLLKVYVYGNNSGYWLRGKIADANDNEVVVDFTKNINWSGWQQVSAQVPSGLKYPIKLKSLYVASLSNSNTAEQKIYFDNLTGVFPTNVDLPNQESTKFTDSKQTSINEKIAGNYYVNLVGSVSSGNVSDKNLYDSERKKVNSTLQNNSDLMVYAGKNDVSFGSDVDTIKWGSTYGFYKKDNVDFVQLTAANGGLRNTFSAQWSTFKSDVLNSKNKNVVFIMDRTPSNFTDSLEADLFRSALKDIKNAGKNVYVISSSGTGSWNTIKDGIRYINLPDLWYNSYVNKNFKMLKLEVSANDIKFDIKSIY